MRKEDQHLLEQMRTWVKSPMEFGQEPTKISIVDRRVLYWPNQRNEECCLIDFEMTDGTTYIGFSGPITWSFREIDFSVLSLEELYLRYTGWYIAFSNHNASKRDMDQSKFQDDSGLLLSLLGSHGYHQVEMKQHVHINGDNYFEFKAFKKEEFRIVGVKNEYSVYSYNAVLPLYEYLGEIWNPFELE